MTITTSTMVAAPTNDIYEKNKGRTTSWMYFRQTR